MTCKKEQNNNNNAKGRENLNPPFFASFFSRGTCVVVLKNEREQAVAPEILPLPLISRSAPLQEEQTDSYKQPW